MVAVRAAGGDPEVSILASLAAFVADLDLKRTPDIVRRQATFCILDTIACMVAGAGTEDGARMIEAEKVAGGAGRAAVVGTSVRLPVEAAARVNGYTGDIFELNDLIGGHASIGVIPAALALAEAGGSSGAELLTAVIAGIETTSRIHAGFRAAVKPYAEIGTAYIGFINTLGAAAAASNLLGFDESRTRNALAIAGALAGWCPAEAIFRDGGTAKPVLFGGWPAATGILAARYAEGGMTGPERVLDGDFGFYGYMASGWDPKAARGADGVWHLAVPRRKLHACCGFFHTALDLAIELRRQHGADIFHGAEIRVALTPRVIAAIAKGGVPSTPNQARFHAEYCIAIVAIGADVILPEHSTGCREHLARPEIGVTLESVRVAADAGLRLYPECRVEVVRGGTVVARATSTAPKGSPENPLADDELIDKFVRLVDARLERNAAAAYAARVQTLDHDSDCRWLAAAFA